MGRTHKGLCAGARGGGVSPAALLPTFIFAIYLGCAARSVFSKEGARRGRRLGPSAAVLTAATHGVSLLGWRLLALCSWQAPRTNLRSDPDDADSPIAESAADAALRPPPRFLSII